MRSTIVFMSFLAVIAAACGQPAVAPGATATPAAAITATPTPGPVTLRVWVRDYTLNQDSPYTTAKKAFEAKYPYVTVEVKGYPYDPLYQGILLSKAGTVKPDVFQMDAYWIGQMADSGLAEKLDSYYAKFDGAKDIPERFLSTSKWKGAYYGVWLNTDVRMFLWNKDLFRQAGLDPNKAPATWDEMISMGLQIKEKVPSVVPIGFPAIAQEATTDRFVPLLFQAGGDVLNPEGTQAIFNSPAGARALQLLVDLVNKHKLTPLTVLSQDDATVRESVLAGKTAMMIVNNGTGMEQAKNVTPDEYRNKFGAGQIPTCTGCQQATTSGGYQLAVHSQSASKDLAFEFIALVTDPKNVTDFLVAQRRIPTRTSLLSNLDQFSKNSPYFPEVAKALATTKFQPFVQQYFPGIEETIWTAIQKSVQSGGNVQANLDAAVATSNKLLGR